MNVIKWDKAIYIVLGIAAITSVGNWFISDQVFSFKFVLNCISASVTTITLASYFFCNKAWKWKIFRKWLVVIPDLNGIWEGTLISDWINPETGKRLDPIKATLTIKQSLFRTSCILTTGESSSRSIESGLIVDPDSQLCRLVYTYQNDPDQTIQERSRIHYGTAMLTVQGTGTVTSLNGSYFTGRHTSGQMNFEKLKFKINDGVT